MGLSRVALEEARRAYEEDIRRKNQQQTAELAGRKRTLSYALSAATLLQRSSRARPPS
jgi:hypothetical protein